VATARSCSRGSTCRPGDHEDVAVGLDQIGSGGGDQPDGAQIGLQRQPLLGWWGRRLAVRPTAAARPPARSRWGRRPSIRRRAWPTKRAATAAASGRSAVALRTNRPVGARSRRSAGVDGGVRQRGGAIAARTVASPSGARPDSGAAYVSAGPARDGRSSAGGAWSMPGSTARRGRAARWPPGRADLFPARRHQVLLLAAHDLVAEPRRRGSAGRG
jgi:hypothetical protein